jgi:ribosomal protein L7/L12
MEPYDHVMTFGWVEFLILAIVVIVPLSLIVIIVVRDGARPTDPLGWRSPGLVLPISADVQHRVRELWAAGRKVEAIKLIREQTGLGLKEAKVVAERLGAGHALPSDVTGDLRPDLAGRVRELKASGRVEQAVFLVRGETGMGQSEAETFVDAL